MTLRDEVQEKYPAGTRIRLIKMIDDPQPIKEGSCGTVRGADDIGNLLMCWDDGRSLSLIPGVDEFVKEDPDEKL